MVKSCLFELTGYERSFKRYLSFLPMPSET